MIPFRPTASPPPLVVKGRGRTAMTTGFTPLQFRSRYNAQDILKLLFLLFFSCSLHYIPTSMYVQPRGVCRCLVLLLKTKYLE